MNTRIVPSQQQVHLTATLLFLFLQKKCTFRIQTYRDSCPQRFVSYEMEMTPRLKLLKYPVMLNVTWKIAVQCALKGISF